MAKCKKDDNAYVEDEYKKLKVKIKTAISRTQLATLMEEAGNLAIMASHLGIDIEILGLILPAVSKVVEQTQDINLNNKIVIQKQERDIREKEVKGIYNLFNSCYQEILNIHRKDNEKLQEVFEAKKAGQYITIAEKQKSKKSPEEIEKEKSYHQCMKITNELAEEEHKYHSKIIEKINNEINNYPSHEHQEIDNLIHQRNYHENGLLLAKEKKEQYEVYNHELIQYAKNLCICADFEKNERNRYDEYANLNTALSKKLCKFEK